MKAQETVLKNIIVIRKNKGLSQDNLAKELGITQSGYALIERGDRKLTIDTLEQIAIILKMNMVDIITFPEILVKPNKNCEDCDKHKETIENLNNYITMLRNLIDNRYAAEDKIKYKRKE